MLSITKINSASNQESHSMGGKGYLHYLGGPSTRERGDFDDYARGSQEQLGPPPFWACKGPALLGLDAIAEAEHVERLARGFHPVTGEALVKGAGDGHVMGLDMTFSAPKDFSAVFAGADAPTREALLEVLQQSAKTALDYAESAVVTRHGVGGRVKQIAEAAIAACYTHFASRALDPQLHVHAFMFNVGKRKDSAEWSALEHRVQFDRKMATGILFRVEMAARLKGLGFGITASGPFFAINGIDDRQRDALSKRSREINDELREKGMAESDGAAREVAALNTRAAKAEPKLPELLKKFEADAKALGITPESVAAMRSASPAHEAEFAIDHQALLDNMMASQSCATAQDALARICELAMGRWDANRCLAEMESFMACEQVVQLGRTEHLTEVFTSKSTKDMEMEISGLVKSGLGSRLHRLAARHIDLEFDRLESELRRKLGVNVSLVQQRKAALHIASETGDHAFIEGWAGTGKTTMLSAVGRAYKANGFKVIGCCQSAAASQNLARETGIPSNTIASLLLSIQNKKAKLSSKTILVLDEAGMVGSREFGMLQKAAADAGAKFVCVGDPKQLQPIEAGGIFASLMRLHGKAEISNIQRQRTDFEPLLEWLQKNGHGKASITAERAKTLRSLPEDARMAAMERLCAADPKLARGFAKWRSRFDYEWMREAVELFATGSAREALSLLDQKGRLKLASGPAQSMNELISAWNADKTSVDRKTIIAATRAEVAQLNAMAREALVSRGLIDDARGIEAEIIHRDETKDAKRFAPGDRIVFTMNDKELGVANGVAGRIREIDMSGFGPVLAVELDDSNELGESLVRIPAGFARFDHAYCLTNHKSQGRTFDSAYVLANPSMADREWTYVAASRSRFATTIFVNAAALGLVDPESHRKEDHVAKNRAAAIEALASRMKRSKAKGTSLDFEEVAQNAIPRPSLMHLLGGLVQRAAKPLSLRREMA
jgi:conjugative relaxase-like TrwC/TraI family protein